MRDRECWDVAGVVTAPWDWMTAHPETGLGRCPQSLKHQKSSLPIFNRLQRLTIDPVSTANPGWTTFLPAYNQWCSDHGGIPLPNRTPMATRAQIEKSLGERWKQFAEARRTFDPNNRLLNDFFRDLLGE